MRPSVVGKWTSNIWTAANLLGTALAVRPIANGFILARNVAPRQYAVISWSFETRVSTLCFWVHDWRTSLRGAAYIELLTWQRLIFRLYPEAGRRSSRSSRLPVAQAG